MSLVLPGQTGRRPKDAAGRKVLITGTAGFIGFHLAKHLLAEGFLVLGIRLLIDTVPERPVDGVVPEGDSLSTVAPWRVVNIGNSDKVRLLDFIEAIETCLGTKAIRNYMPMQPGDVPATWAGAQLLQRLTGYQPQTDIRRGITEFVSWFRGYYGK